MSDYPNTIVDKKSTASINAGNAVVKPEPLVGKIFNNKLWRKIISEACNEIDSQNIGLEVISPWGFELLEDKYFLTKNLRRFYCYIGAAKPSILDRKAIISAFKQAVSNRLELLRSRMLDDLVLIIEHDELKKLKHDGYLCNPTDKLLDIQFRTVERDILTDYANYVIASLDGLCFSKGESSEIYKNKIRRYRFYQLYIMQEQLYRDILPPMTIEEQHAYLSLFPLIDNMIQLFYEPELNFSIPSEQERRLLDGLAKNRLNLIRTAISPKENAVTISSVAYHIEDKLELTLDKGVYENAFNKIKWSYLNFL